MIYAEWGAGKTFLAATAQDCKAISPCLHLGFEQGLLTVAYRKDYDAKEIRTIDDLEKAVNLLDADVRSDKPYYKTLIMDNATELQTLDKDTIMRTTKRLARDPDKVDIDIPSPREWGKIKSRLRRAVTGVRDMPINTIWTAWRAEDYNESTNITSYYPNVQGSIKTELGGYFDIVGYLTFKKTGDTVTRYLQIQGTDRVKAKWRNRPPEVPDVLENPTMEMIYDYVQMSRIATG